MNAKQRVMAAIKHQPTDRVPMFFDCTTVDLLENLISFANAKDEEDLLRKLDIDCRWCVCMDDFIGENTYADGTFFDMWGIEKTRFGGIPVSHPLADAETIEDLEAYPHWPSPDDIDYDKFIEKMKTHSEYMVFGGMWSPFLEQASLLVGMEKLMIMMFEDEAFVHALLDKTLEFYLECNKRMFEKAGNLMQIFFMGDDYGTQNSLLYGPALWRKFIKPRLAKLYSLAKSHGYLVQQHSCGSVVELIPDLIEIGLDGLHPIQVTAKGMSIRELKAKCGGQLYFMGAIDAMHLLTEGSDEEIEQQISETLALFKDDGGYIFGPSQGFLPEMPVKNILMMYKMGKKHGTRNDQ